MFLYVVDLLGVAVFAVSGALVGIAVIVALRLATIVWGLRVPAFSLDRD